MTAMTVPTQRKEAERTVRDIISAARSVRRDQVARVGMMGAVCASFTYALLMWLSFTPVNASPLAWLAPVPLLLMIRIDQKTRWMYSSIYVASVGCQLATLQWMRLGDPTMYIAWAALSLYTAGYAVAFVAISRVAVHRLGLPLVLAAPVVWVGGEYFRAHLLTGFSWYYLGHTQYRWLELIQISDLTGAYGVSFLMVMSAACLALLVPYRWLIKARLVLASTGPTVAPGMTLSQILQITATSIIFASVLGYGYNRRAQADFKPGPRVALIQGNFVASLREEPVDPIDMHSAHMRLNALAVREQAQILIWPEAMFPWPILSAEKGMTNEQLRDVAPMVAPDMWHDETVRAALEQESHRSGAALIFGISSAHVDQKGIHQRNSAVFVTPNSGVSQRYDKIHLVPFGEYIPLAQYLPFMQSFNPYREAGGLEPGEHPAIFQYENWRIAPVICFEDTVPHLVRQIVAAGSESENGKPVDLLVNMTNDGWFHGSSELDQHLITAAFRAVECRTPMVRAVNTGISAIIDGDGAIREPDVFIDGDHRKNSPTPARTSTRDPKTGAWHKQLSAALVHTVPLDSRRSLYVRFGDWFGMLCSTGFLLAAASGVISQFSRSRIAA